MAKKRNLHFAFVHLEKLFDLVPSDVVWWALRKLDIKELLVKTVQSIYWNVEGHLESMGLSVMISLCR